MIDKSYINAAIQIRSEYIKLTKEVEKHHNKLKEIGERFINVAGELNDIKNNLSKYPNAESAQKDIFGKLGDIETESVRLNNLITPINNRMDDLKKQETSLYNSIKEKYPEISDDELREQLKQHLV